jgi:hypothetical protein
MATLTRGEQKALALHRGVAAAAVTGESTFYLVGSAAILPSLRGDTALPDAVRRSREADLIPASGSTRSIDLIDGALGLDSTFDGTFGYYADGVDFSTVRYAPAGWRDRTIRFESRATGGAVGLCMEAHDLVITKLFAGRDKGLEFVRSLVQERQVDIDILGERLEMVDAPGAVTQAARDRLRGCAGV